MASSKVSASDMQMRKYVRRQLKKRGVTPTPKLEERSARERRLRKKFREEYKSKNAPKAKPARPNVGDAKDNRAARRAGVGDAKDRMKGSSRKPNLTKGFDSKDRRTGATGNARSRVGDAKDRMGRKSPTSGQGMYPAKPKRANVGDAKDRMKASARKASPTSAPGMYPKPSRKAVGDAKDRIGRKRSSGSSRGKASVR